MIELIYKKNHRNLCLYEIKNGITELIKTFSDEEELLLYIESTYEYAKLYCGNNINTIY